MITCWTDGGCEQQSLYMDSYIHKTMLTEVEKAWMAGFVDGEGSLTISRQDRKNRPSPTYKVSITVTNTKRNSLDLFIKEYNGHTYQIHDYRKDKRKVNWADAYTWYCSVSSSERFLIEMLPYLRLKGQQAKLILKFIKTKDGFNRVKRIGQAHGSAPLSKKEIEHREKLRQQVHLLNSKGQDARKALAVGVMN